MLAIRRLINPSARSEERRVGKECRARWSEDQAEDGIRDFHVTGVQTCALPIYNSTHPAIALVRDAISASSEAQIAQRGVVVRPAAEWPVKLAVVFGDRHVVDAGDSPAHQPVGKIGRASCRERV